MNVGFITAKHAALTPGREAVIDAETGQRITFAELDEQVRRLANGLTDQLGLDRGDRVAILSKNSI
jgi:acyl-CoA synthetase (AMP-forming)/AMP-acid ligase II